VEGSSLAHERIDSYDTILYNTLPVSIILPSQKATMPDDDDVIVMARCSHCNHFVPEHNFPLHEARCQKNGRKRPATRNTDGENEEEDQKPAARCQNDDENEEEDRKPAASRQHARGHRNATHGNTENHRLTLASWERPPTAMGSNREITTVLDDSMDEEDEVMEVPPVAAAASANSQQEVIDLMSDGDSWNCPQCTLINSTSSGYCGACNYRNPQYERPADATRRERLMDDMGVAPGNSPFGGLIGSGALIGSVIGASGAYMRGQPVSSGVLNGALAGAMGGAVLNEAMRSDPRQEQSADRSAAYVSSRTRSLNMVRTSDGRVIVQQSRGGGVPNNPDLARAEMMMMQLMAGRHGQPFAAASTDNMSYEQLLQSFGSGTENLGANEGQIRSLPSAIVEDANRLPTDSRQCSICLEDFESGEERKIMPCLHGFHAICLDKWLRNNGNCPMCKHRLGS
jgi:hypothetical protein